MFRVLSCHLFRHWDLDHIYLIWNDLNFRIENKRSNFPRSWCKTAIYVCFSHQTRNSWFSQWWINIEWYLQLVYETFCLFSKEYKHVEGSSFCLYFHYVNNVHFFISRPEIEPVIRYGLPRMICLDRLRSPTSKFCDFIDEIVL